MTFSYFRNVSERHFLQALPALSGPKGRRRHQIEEQGLTQRFAVSLLFHNRTLLQGLLSFTKTSFKNTVSKQTLVAKQLQGLLYGDLSPAQILEVCHCMHEASTTYGEGNRGSCSAQLVSHMVENLPAFLSFCGIPLRPPDVFTVKYILEKGGAQGRGFRLDLEDTGIQVSGLKSVVGLNNIKTYRYHNRFLPSLFWTQPSDPVTGNLWFSVLTGLALLMWLRSGSSWRSLVRRSSSNRQCPGWSCTLWKSHRCVTWSTWQSWWIFMCIKGCRTGISSLCMHTDTQTHPNNLITLLRQSFPCSCTQSDSILAEGVPAIRELRKLEFE